MEQPSLNDHNKQEYPPMHTTEHVINRTMVNLFGCDDFLTKPVSQNALEKVLDKYVK